MKNSTDLDCNDLCCANGTEKYDENVFFYCHPDWDKCPKALPPPWLCAWSVVELSQEKNHDTISSFGIDAPLHEVQRPLQFCFKNQVTVYHVFRKLRCICSLLIRYGILLWY